MYHDLPLTARFWWFLFTIDQDLANAIRENGCSCGGRLHSADYPRKPRGTPASLPELLRIRLSFCCDRDGCRKRTTPPSVRFLGRKVYLGAIVILISAMRQGPSPRRVRELSARFGVDQRTIARWQVFWREHFPQSTFLENRTRPFGTDCPDHQPPILARGRLPQPSSRLHGLDTPAPVPRTDHDPRRPLNQDIALSCDDRFFPQKMSSTCLDHFMEDVTVPSPQSFEEM